MTGPMPLIYCDKSTKTAHCHHRHENNNTSNVLTTEENKVRWRAAPVSALRPAAAPHRQDERKGENESGREIAHSSIRGGSGGPRQPSVKHTFGPQRQPVEDPTERIDHRRNSRVGGAHQRKPLLDGADTCLLKMLIGTGTRPEPTVIGEIEHPARSLARRNRLIRKNDFVADQWNHIGGARHREHAAAITRDEPSAHIGDLPEPELLEECLKGQVFAER